MSEVVFMRSPVPGPSTKKAADPLPSASSRASTNRLSPLIWTSIFAPIFGGPLGSVAAIVFGWAARREPNASASSSRRFLSTLGIVLGLLLTVVWGAVLAFVVISFERRAEQAAQTGTIETTTAAIVPTNPPESTSSSGATEEPAHVHHKQTTAHREGLVTIVDIGASVSSLAQELAKERAEAARTGDVTLVMTMRQQCPTCQHVSQALGDPLMQTALAHVRLVRVDVDLFADDLSGLKIPSDRLPGFYLLAPDLFPRDAIDGGEWDADIVTNMAPVLAAFVRGKYGARRQSWPPVTENGIRL